MPKSDHIAADSVTPAAAERLMRALDDGDAPTESPPGSPNIPGYRVDRVAGQGGGGSVYRAFRKDSDRPVALKVVRDLAGESGLRRAWRELEMLESLRLACVPRILDYGVHDGRLFIAEEFVEGERLDAYCAGLDRGELRTRVMLLERAARAVQQLHERGVIHRDLKPGNILVTPAGDVMIVDFGLAFHADAPVTTISQTDSPVGTPAFMAPEQARGERANVSTRTDVYGLGATAYEILTGQTPHDTHTSVHEAIRRVAFEPPREARSLRPDLPKGLAAVLGKACAREAGARYGSAGELAEELERWLRGEAVEAGLPGAWTRVVRWAGRHPVKTTAALASGVGICVLGLTTIAGVAGWYYFKKQVIDVRVAGDLSRVQLLTRTNEVVHEWELDRPPDGYAPPVAKLARLASERGGGRVLLLSSHTTRSLGPAYCGLACFRVDPNPDYEHPMWSTGFKTPDIEAPIGLRDSTDTFRANRALLADVFTDPDHPGEEAVVSHIHASEDRSCVRVYDLATGAVLSEAWHVGACSVRAFIPDNSGGLIVLRGVSNPHTYAQPIENRPPLAAENYPQVYFALRPTLRDSNEGSRDRAGVVNLRFPGQDRDPPDTAWYRFLDGPLTITTKDREVCAIVVEGPSLVPATETSVELKLVIHACPPGVEVSDDAAPRGSFGMNLFVDPRTGQVLRSQPSEEWKVRMGQAWESGQWRLVDTLSRATRPWTKPDSVPWP